MPRRGNDDGQADLAPGLVRYPNDREVLDIRGIDQHKLDLCRVDVLPAGLVHLLDPPGEVVIAIGIAPSDVAGAQPVTRCEVVRILATPVADGDAGPAHPDLAVLIDADILA